jgi:DNA-binding NtrC family response regulator
MLNGGGDPVAQDFPQRMDSAGIASVPGSEVVAGIPSTTPHAGVADQEQVRPEGAAAPDARADRPALARYGIARLLDERGEMRPIGALEEEVIRFAIDHYCGRMSEVARRLGIGRSTLYRRLKDYGIASGEPAAP